MGAEHARILAFRTPGACLQSIYDADASRSKALAAETSAPSVAGDPLALVHDPDVDAVVIASPDATHHDLVIACLEARKPVLCEKPLAATESECHRIVEAETAIGRRLVQVGYMRRFDPWYVDLKTRLESKRLGAPLMLHCAHRNVSAPTWFDSRMSITNSAVHEFDIVRWLLSDDLVGVQTFQPGVRQPNAAGAPVFLVLETERGRLVDIEVHVNAAYGYDVVAELVCEKGTLSLGSNTLSTIKSERASGAPFPEDWRGRFAEAYRLQMQAWIRSAAGGTPGGSSAWDGYMAAIVANAALRSLERKGRAAIERPARPTLYD